MNSYKFALYHDGEIVIEEIAGQVRDLFDVLSTRVSSLYIASTVHKEIGAIVTENTIINWSKENFGHGYSSGSIGYSQMRYHGAVDFTIVSSLPSSLGIDAIIGNDLERDNILRHLQLNLAIEKLIGE